MWLASKSRNELFYCRRRTIQVDLRQYFCYRLLKNSRNDFLLRYIDDAVCIQSEFGNDRKADEGEGHKNADVFRYAMCLEGIVQRLHFRRNTLCAFRTVLPASIISVSLSPATIRLWESCAMLDATAPHFRLKFPKKPMPTWPE